MAARHLFSVFDVTRQVFFESANSLGIVNLKPLRPGHVLIISKRNVPRLADLEPWEVSDLFQSVQRVGTVIEKAYAAEALNIALQDGVSAGQSVPHVHVHVIPRLVSDFGGVTDNVYPALEASERDLAGDLAAVVPRKENGDASASAGANGNGTVGGTGNRPVTPVTPPKAWQVPKDEDRVPRSMEEMEAEAAWLRERLRDAGVSSV